MNLTAKFISYLTLITFCANNRVQCVYFPDHIDVTILKAALLSAWGLGYFMNGSIICQVRVVCMAN